MEPERLDLSKLTREQLEAFAHAQVDLLAMIRSEELATREVLAALRRDLALAEQTLAKAQEASTRDLTDARFVRILVGLRPRLRPVLESFVTGEFESVTLDEASAPGDRSNKRLTLTWTGRRS